MRPPAAEVRLRRLVRRVWLETAKHLDRHCADARKYTPAQRLRWLREALGLTRKEVSSAVLRIDDESARHRWARYESGQVQIPLDLLIVLGGRVGLPLDAFADDNFERVELHALVAALPVFQIAAARRELVRLQEGGG